MISRAPFLLFQVQRRPCPPPLSGLELEGGALSIARNKRRWRKEVFPELLPWKEACWLKYVSEKARGMVVMETLLGRLDGVPCGVWFGQVEVV